MKGSAARARIGRRDFLGLGAAAVLALRSRARAALGGPAAGTAAAVYGRAAVVDGCGTLVDDKVQPGRALPPQALADARDSGVTCVNVTVGPVGSRPSLVAFEGLVRDIAFWEQQLEAHPETLVKVRSSRDVDAARSGRRLGLVYGLQDGVSFQDDLARLDTLHGLGVRIIQPTYNLRNLLGDGCLEAANAGLSRLGHEAVERMDALRILVDLSHCGRATARDAMAAARRPVAFTHTACAALADHPRNRTDDELRALAQKGGVAGIYFMPYLRPSGQPMAEDVVRHVEHAVNVAG